MIRVTVCGAAGRIGSEVARAVAAADEMAFVLAVERRGHPAVGATLHGAPVVDDLAAGFRESDVIIDFTTPPATGDTVRLAAEQGVAFISGTTGLDDPQQTALRAAAERIPVVYAPNMSMGVSVVTRLIRDAVRLLPAYDIEIVEMHHRRKKDAPSGTALKFAEVLEATRRDLRRIFGRSGATGERASDEIALHSLRGGDVVGEHHVIFAGPGERVVVTHRAESRGAFVAGVLQAVRFVADRAPGFYGMEDVLGIRE